jgi:hypothetical protein
LPPALGVTQGRKAPLGVFSSLPRNREASLVPRRSARNRSRRPLSCLYQAGELRINSSRDRTNRA